jgi:hypothetical protein
LAINFKDVNVPDSAGSEVTVTIMKKDGDFTDGIATLGKTTGGSVDLIVTDANLNTITGAGFSNLRIHIRENVAGALDAKNSTLKLKLPQGFKWRADGNVVFFNTATPAAITAEKDDERTLVLNRTSDSSITDKNIFTVVASVDVDEDVAKFGDVNVTVSGASTSNMDSVLIGKYADFGYEIIIDKEDIELTAGVKEQEISTFKIKELIANSVAPGRTVYVELPDGIEWAAAPSASSVEGGFNIAFTVDDNNKSKLRGKINTEKDQATKGSATFKDPVVNVAVDYTGPVTLTFSGNSGIEGDMEAATVVAPITATAETKEVIIGMQAQAAGNIVISETMAEAVMSRAYGASKAKLALTAPFGVTWDKLPTLEVIEGDLIIEKPERGYSDSGKHVLYIPIRTQSSVASKIEISDIVYTLDRTVPEGDLKIAIGGDAVDQVNMKNRTTAATVVAATVVTPAPGDVMGNGEFRIGSNVYYVGGVAKVMDVAPYIKSDRTYVPMRYLGEILGAEVVWDDAARTVTLTKGDTTVVFTIGSTTYTVNGEAKTAVVAPEIASDRTMLPARFVAEAFGAVVGWDPGTQTVVISK